MRWNISDPIVDQLAPNKCLDLTFDDATANSMRYNTVGFVVITIIMPAFAIFGVTANLSFLFVVYARKSMRTVTNAYLANLAVADILFLISATVPAEIQFFSSPVIFDQLPIKAQGCASVNCVIFLFFYASVFMVFLVSFERYNAICHPLHQRVVMGSARTAKLIAGTWTTAIMFSCLVIPSLSVMEKSCIVWPEGPEFDGFPPVVGQCRPLAKWVYYASSGLKMVPFFAAMFSSGYIYARIVVQLNKKLPGLATRRRYNHAMTRVLRSRRQISVMLIATGAIFFACQAPAQISTLAAMITDNTDAQAVLSRGQRGVMQWVSRMLLFFNSAVNPLVYNVTNARYRKAFMDTYGCNQKKKWTVQKISTVKSVYLANGNNAELYNSNIEREHSSL